MSGVLRFVLPRRHGLVGTGIGDPTLLLEMAARNGVKNLTMVTNTIGFDKDVWQMLLCFKFAEDMEKWDNRRYRYKLLSVQTCSYEM